MALLETRELTKSYDAVAALQAVSLSVESGTVLGLIGENGAGKSTFAKCVTGLIRPTSGGVQPGRGPDRCGKHLSRAGAVAFRPA